MAKRIEGRPRKDKLVVRARDVTSAGACAGWLEVVRKFVADDEATLRIYLTARDKDELDALCEKARKRFSKDRGNIP